MTVRSAAAPDGVAPAPQVRLLLGAVFLVFLGQMTLNPIIAPLSREVDLAEWQVGATISTAAIVVVLTSQFWGRRSQSWGRKPVLVAALLVGVVAMALFALVAGLGMAGVLAPAVLFALFVLLRGLGFGIAIAAVPPTAQAYIADVTPDERTRVKGMAGVGAVQGIAMIAGSVVGGVLSVFGLITPLIAVPVLLALGLVLVVFRLRRETRVELIERPARVRPTDPRVWPFLLAGFGMFTALGFIQVITGFLVQDRFGLDAETTGLVTGGAMLAAGLAWSWHRVSSCPAAGGRSRRCCGWAAPSRWPGSCCSCRMPARCRCSSRSCSSGSASASRCPATPRGRRCWSSGTSRAGSPG